MLNHKYVRPQKKNTSPAHLETLYRLFDKHLQIKTNNKKNNFFIYLLNIYQLFVKIVVI